MATLVGVGESVEVDALDAGAEAATKALARAGADRCDIALVFGTVGYDQQRLIDGINSVTGGAPLVGCSADGIITHRLLSESPRAVAVMLISSDALRFKNVMMGGLRDNSRGVGRALGESLCRDWPADPLCLIILPDGLTVNADALFKGLEESLAGTVPFTGGSAGDYSVSMVQTYQYCDHRVTSDAVSCVLVSGGAEAEFGVSHGCEPVGLLKTVTRAEGNRICEVDGRPAFDALYKDVLGEDAKLEGDTLVQMCLGSTLPFVEDVDVYEHCILRVPVRWDQSDGSLIIPSEWPAGTKIMLNKRSPEKIIESIRKVATRMQEKHRGRRPMLVLDSNCAGRSPHFLGEEVGRQEVDAVLSTLASDVPFIGWYTYGEIAPVAGKNHFHNWTSSLLALF